MNITVEKIKRTLEKDYGYANLRDNGTLQHLIDSLISDTLKAINNELIRHKGISIKNTKQNKQNENI